MRKLNAFSIGIAILLSSACSTKLDVTAPYKVVPIIYGVLDPSDSIQYIKISRTYLNEQGSAIGAGKSLDSNFYPYNSIRPVLIESLNNAIDTIELDTQMIAHDSGNFGYTQYPIYYTKQAINKAAKYQFLLYKSGNAIATSSTTVPSVSAINSPTNTASQAFVVGQAYQKINYSITTANNTSSYELNIIFHYTEKNNTTGVLVDKYLDWYLGTSAIVGGYPTFNVSGGAFYAVIADKLSPDPSVTRTADNFLTFKYTTVSADLTKLIQLSRFTGSVNENPPEYTNVSNGLGIFSAKNKLITGYTLNPSSMQELKSGKITGHLGFK